MLRSIIVILVIALTAGAAWRLGRRLGGGAWTDSALGAGVSFFCIVVAVCAALGFAGAISPVTVAASSVIASLIIFIIVKPPKVDFPRPVRLPAPALIFIALAAVALTGVFLWDVATPPPAGGDPFIYHLTFPATWLKAGRIVYVPLPYGAQAATYYPLNMELFYLWLMAPAGDDLLVNLGQLPGLLIAGLAVAGIARTSGIGRPGAVIGAAAVMLAPGLVQQATVARVDVTFAAWFVVSLYFALRWGATRRAGHLLLFGASTGLLIGTKSIGLLYVSIPAALFLFQMRGRGARAAADIAVAAVAAVAFGGFWYARNLAVTGNPVFPLNVELFGRTIFQGAYGSGAMQAFHTSDPLELIRIVQLFLGFWLIEYMFLCVFAAGVAGIVFGIRRVRGRLFMMAVPWLLLALFWFVNPHNNLTNGRFLFPAILMLGYYTALIVDEAADLPGRIFAWAAPAALTVSSFIFQCDHLPRLLGDLAGLVSGGGNELLKPAAGAIALSAAAAVIFFIYSALRGKPVARSIAAAACFLFLLFGLRLAFDYHHAYKYDWYGMFTEGRAWKQLEDITKGKSLRIASVGSERLYGLFGSGLRHDVFTVDVDARNLRQFHEYWRAARRAGAADPDAQTERPQWHRAEASPDAWITNLRAARTDLIFATVLDRIARVYMNSDELGFPVEVGWAESRPETFKIIFANSEVRIFALKPEE